MASVGNQRFNQGIILHKFLKKTGGDTSQFISEGHHYPDTKTRQNIMETPDKYFPLNTKSLIKNLKEKKGNPKFPRDAKVGLH